MFKQLLRIIWKERSSNAALWVELLLAAIFLFYTTSEFYARRYVVQQPMGCDIEHVYQLRFGFYPPSASQFKYDTAQYTPERRKAFWISFLNELRALPGVEAAAVSSNSLPHQASNMTTALYVYSMREGKSAQVGNREVLERIVTPGFFEVFKVEKLSEDCPALPTAVENFEDDCILSSALCASLGYQGRETELIGQRVHTSFSDTAETFRVVGISKPMRVDNYWSWSTQLFRVFSENLLGEYLPQCSGVEIAIRVSPEADNQFADRFMQDYAPRLQIGNLYISGISSIQDNKYAFQHGERKKDFYLYLFSLFILFSVLLGVVGAFWYRTQQRREQIGIRLSMGDRPARLLNYYVLEGLVLLYSTFPLVVLSAYLLTRYQLGQYYYLAIPGRMLLGLLATYLIMSLAVWFGIWLPGHKAVRIPIAEAVKDK